MPREDVDDFDHTPAEVADEEPSFMGGSNVYTDEEWEAIEEWDAIANCHTDARAEPW